jgi:hypothetical protein
MTEGIRKKLEEFEQDKLKKLQDEQSTGVNSCSGWSSYIISEKINIFAEAMEELINNLKEERKRLS